ALLEAPSSDRTRALREQTDRKLGNSAATAMAAATTVADMHAALLPVVDLAATPDVMPCGAMVLQPSEERRRSASHSRTADLTDWIVGTAVDRILTGLGGKGGRSPRPDVILDVKVCDPAMGSGAFLVEACRYLGDALVEAWRAHDARPEIPPDEDEVVFARRL